MKSESPLNLKIGWDTRDITPNVPVELIGQYYQRISKSVRDPLAVAALALEQQTGDGTEQAVMVSVDILFVTKDFLEEVRAAISQKIPGLDPRMIFLNATHTHSAPAWFAPFRWWKPSAQTPQPAEIRAVILKQIVRAVQNAWNSRQPAGVSFATVNAAIGFSRRTLYTDGSAEMYGRTDRNDFIGIEAGSDPAVRMLFTWNAQDQLTGLIVNVACPAQVMEAQHVVSADFFGELRRRICAAHGPQVHLLAQLSAAGDQAPRNLPAQMKDEVNYWNESGMLAIAGRLEEAISEGYAAARQRIERAPVLRHSVTEIILPVRRAGAGEYQAARAAVQHLTANHPDESAASRELFERFIDNVRIQEKSLAHGPFDNKELEFVQLENAQAVIQRFESQESTPGFALELHALRLGQCAFVTNPFELYLDFGSMIRARSPARETFLVQLACDAGGYLSTARAEAAGGYGSLIINGRVGAEGGRMLVEASVNAIENLWKEKQA
jgi:hypothetical protein